MADLTVVKLVGKTVNSLPMRMNAHGGIEDEELLNRSRQDINGFGKVLLWV